MEAPDNHTITVIVEDIDIEHIHNDLTFYDGPTLNSTIIKHLTGTHENITMTSTGKYMTVANNSDTYGFGRGYHLTEFAVPTESADSIKSDRILLRFLCWLPLFILIGIILLTIYHFCSKRRRTPKQPLSFLNEMVRFKSETDDSEPIITVSL
ncbi:unnamed protein product [Caenorhabditis sp. 36 PRJEB53466]|nr:unnamed protein product [Caenorhabditis sp. 36 PRJEB53466]